MNLTDFNIPLICFVSFILVVWFESDIIQTIANLTKTRSLLKINEYHKYKLEVDVMSNYPNFLYEQYPGYLTKLLSCPICLCFWTTLTGLVILTISLNNPIILSLLLIPVNYISSLLIYLSIKKLL